MFSISQARCGLTKFNKNKNPMSKFQIPKAQITLILPDYAEPETRNSKLEIQNSKSESRNEPTNDSPINDSLINEIRFTFY